MGHTRGHLWTPDEDQLILDYLAMGMSARQIADAIGGASRNAVIGRIMRAKELREQGFTYKAGEQLRTRIEVKKNVIVEAIEALPQHGKVLLHLGANECKWPVAYDPEVVGHYWFCAKPVQKGHIYCARHVKVKQRGANYV
jgi:hypothetical protein